MKYFITKYKVPFLISLVIAMDIIAVKSRPNITVGLLIFLFSVVAIFILDLDLFLYKKFLSPQKEIKFFKLKEYLDETQSKSTHQLDLLMHNALFQVLVVFFSFYVVTVKGNVFSQAFMLSLYSNIIYRQLNEYNTHSTLERWFNFYEGQKDRKFYFLYFTILVLILIYLLLAI